MKYLTSVKIFIEDILGDPEVPFGNIYKVKSRNMKMTQRWSFLITPHPLPLTATTHKKPIQRPQLQMNERAEFVITSCDFYGAND